ncbi:LysR substrate-binding domain-containing protein [Microbacterium sp. YY-01]|uniref:LysR substrate-binding domain-containing protein n=1 Tax=Microbacterium sp. YY-01 TaxID=3421634 RepID=UPI003D16690D
MFELRRLRLLRELALRGTLASVAEALSYSPSTVSQQLSLLEKEAGVTLFVPDGRRVRLTASGQSLAAHAERMLALNEEARAELESLQALAAPVRVAVMQTAAQSLLPTALTIVAEHEPQLRVEAAEVPPEEALFELAARGYDIVVAEQYPGHARQLGAQLVRQSLGDDPIRLALPPESAAQTLSDLHNVPWVLEPRGTAARRWSVQQCRAAGFEPDVRFEVADLTTQVRLIAAGRAVGLLPDLVWNDSARTVRLLDLPGNPTREIFTTQRSSSVARNSIRTVLQALQQAFTQRQQAVDTGATSTTHPWS